MRNALLLLLGLAIGAGGAILIRGSIPPPAGSLEAKILSLEDDLRETQLRLAKIDPAQARTRENYSGSLREGARAMMDDLKAGRPVDVNHIFQAAKPLLRDLSPIFDNIRRKQERREFERIAGEMSRKYNLTGPQQEKLKQWLKERADRNAEMAKKIALDPDSRLEDMVRASKDVRPDDGLDGFMEDQLEGQELESFRRDRLTERAERVQQEADWKVERLNGTVGLDEDQKDKVFSIMARSSRDFDPQMQIEGVTADASSASGTDRDAAIMEVLRPEQQASYNDWREKRRAEAELEFTEIGLKMPDGWDALTAD